MGVISKLVFFTKSVVAATLLSSCAVYGVVASVALSLVGKGHLSQWTTARCFYGVMGSIMGIKVNLINGERFNNLPAIFISNHQSELDILMLGRTFPQGCTVTAKKQLKWVPFLGWFMSLSGTLFLDRSNKEKAIKVLNDSLKTLKKEKRALWIFPEGTRPYSTKLELSAFKKGAFHLAQQGKIPIIPVVVQNTSTIYNPKLGIFNRGTINVKVLEPIETENLKTEEIGPLCESVYRRMSEELEELGYAEAIVDTSLPEDAIEYYSQESKEVEAKSVTEVPSETVDEDTPVPENINTTHYEPTERTSLLQEYSS